MLLYYSRQL